MGTDSGYGVEVGQLRDQPGAVHRRLAHADDAAGADLDAGGPHVGQGVQPVLVLAGADHVLVILGGGVQVVVVVVQAGLLEGACLVRFQHAQRGAGLQAQALHGRNQLGHLLDVAVLGRAPGRAHAKAGGAGIPGGLGGGGDLLHVHQLLRLHARVEGGRLGAVAAVFRAAAGLHGQQGGQLYFASGPMLTVHGLRAPQQLHEGQVEQRLHGLHAPALPFRPGRRRGAARVEVQRLARAGVQGAGDGRIGRGEGHGGAPGQARHRAGRRDGAIVWASEPAAEPPGGKKANGITCR